MISLSLVPNGVSIKGVSLTTPGRPFAYRIPNRDTQTDEISQALEAEGYFVVSVFDLDQAIEALSEGKTVTVEVEEGTNEIVFLFD